MYKYIVEYVLILIFDPELIKAIGFTRFFKILIFFFYSYGKRFSWQ